MKKRSEYSPIEWARLYPHQRYLAIQAESDDLRGRNTLQIRAENGIDVIHLDPVTKAPAQPAMARRIGGLV